MTCDETAEDRVNRGANRSTSLRCVCHSCGWPSCPLACGGTRGAHQRERPEGARWGGWARKTGVGAAAGAQSPPPGDYTGHYRTWSWATHGATVQDQGNSHLVQKRFDPQEEQASWLAMEKAPFIVAAWLIHFPHRPAYMNWTGWMLRKSSSVLLRRMWVKGTIKLFNVRFCSQYLTCSTQHPEQL